MELLKSRRDSLMVTVQSKMKNKSRRDGLIHNDLLDGKDSDVKHKVAPTELLFSCWPIVTTRPLLTELQKLHRDDIKLATKGRHYNSPVGTALW